MALTRRGVKTAQGTRYFDSEAEAAQALAKAMSGYVQPASAQVPGMLEAPELAAFFGGPEPVGRDFETGEFQYQRPSTPPAPATKLGALQEVLTDPKGALARAEARAAERRSAVSFAAPDQQEPMPQVVQPGFRSTVFDRAGNVRRIESGDQRPTTLPGTLLRVLFSAARGGMDALASGALEPGANFGTGVRGAQFMPQLRQQQYQANRRAELQNQAAEQEAAYLPVLRALGIEKVDAQIDRDRSLAEASRQKTAFYRQKDDAFETPEEQFRRRQNEAIEDFDLEPGTPEFNKYVAEGKVMSPPRPARQSDLDVYLETQDTSTPQAKARAIENFYAARRGPERPDRAAGREANKRKRTARAEKIAAEFMTRAQDDPDQALIILERAAANADDPEELALMPEIRKAIREYRRKPKPQSRGAKIGDALRRHGVNVPQVEP